MIGNFFKQSTSNQAKIINGKYIANSIIQECKLKIEKLTLNTGLKPGLAIIQIGDRQDSNIYIKNKLKTAQSIELNKDSSINGIITQLPLENFNKFDYTDLTNQVLPEKDVDCLNIINLNKIFNGDLKGNFIPCAAKATAEILDLIERDLRDKQVVIVGSSKLVGIPLKYILEYKNAKNVLLCNDKTQNIQDICRKADILIVAIGCSRFINGNYVKSGAIVIDVGINFNKMTNKVTGDVNFEEVVQKASYITPVPGGVGPITVSILMENVYMAALKSLNKK
ncbi:unnamed protein product [Brachionus calyciflorus]|uniref:Methenyltetrahydrofolate cyclohydrolase n=1 Tax=Brachionus calyciflorus TaxID=104777 RepID=A0A814BD84_9BILA|nr:unnamed protein product [Brachionus calyciflorus]